MPTITDLGFSRHHRRETVDVNFQLPETNQLFPDLGFTDDKIETLSVDKLIAGIIRSQTITLDVLDTRGDVYIAGGTFDAAAWTATNGFILGLDDSASNREKFYLGNATNWIDWNVTTADALTVAGAFAAGSIDIGGADATSFHVDVGGNMWLGAATFDLATNPFAVSSGGSLRARDGLIGGFEIGTDYIRDVANSFGMASTVTGGDDVRFWSGDTFANRATAPFRITEAGVVTATSGTIGGFTLSSTTITATNLTFTSGIANTANILVGTGATAGGLNSAAVGGDIIFWGGAAFADRATAPFRVTAAGALTATSATITGTITATAGAIGGFDIGSDFIRDAANSMGLASTVTGGDDVRFWAGDTFANRATAPFRVTESGVVTATSVTTINITTTFQLSSVTLTATSTEINQALDGIGATVTDTNLTTLTDASNADALHTHDYSRVYATTLGATTLADDGGVGAERTITSYTITGGDMETAGMLKISFQWLMTLSGASGTLRIDLGGTDFFTSNTFSANTQGRAEFIIANNASDSAQNARGYFNNVAATGEDISDYDNNITGVIDTSANQTLSITGQITGGDGNDDITIYNVVVELLQTP